jgi:hypothetical protein
VDELGEKVALYDALGLARWPASSFVFGSRTGFLQVRTGLVRLVLTVIRLVTEG